MLLLLHADGRTRSVPLSSSALIGRAPTCHARLIDTSVPLYWLEVRWLGDGWGWRTLGADLHTRGQGAPDAAGWRPLRSGAGRAHRVTLGPNVWVELVHEGPPEAFVVDLSTGERVTGEELDAVVEAWPDRLLPLSAEGNAARALADGEVFVVGERAFRACVPHLPEQTNGARMDLRDGVDVDIDVAARVAVFTQGAAEATVRGECVRVLAVYADARRSGEGWLTPQEAWERWLAMGAPATWPLERVGWERTRLRAALARARVGGLAALFETQRDGMEWRLRLGERVWTG